MIVKISFNHPKWFVQSYPSSASYMKFMALLRSHEYPTLGGAWLRRGAMSTERVKGTNTLALSQITPMKKVE